MSGALAIDTETTWKFKAKCCNIPFIATTCDEELRTDLFDLRKSSGRIDFRRKIKKFDTKVFHNAPYDLTCLANLGIEVRGPYEDTGIQANILNENFETKSLKPLAKIYLNEPCNEEKELSKIKAKLKREATKAGKVLMYDMIPANILNPYAIKDPWYTIRLWQLFNKSIGKYQDVYELELALIPIIVGMQRIGMRIDRKFVLRMFHQYNEEQKIVEKELIRQAKKEAGIRFTKEKDYKNYPSKPEKWTTITETETGFHAVLNLPYNPKSTPQLRKVLQAYGLNLTTLTKTGKDFATDKVALEPFKDHPFVKNHLRNLFLSKQTGTYYGPLYEWYTSDETDRAHFGLYQTGAKSGRFSAELIQTIPRKDEDKTEENIRVIRNAFVPAKGYNLGCIDYDQIEMRLFAHFAKCGPLIKGILAGMDPHDSTTITLFGKKAQSLLDEIEALTKRLKKTGNKKVAAKIQKHIDKCKKKFKAFRRIAKTINFGIIYGMGQNKLAAALGMSTWEARDILNVYYRNYPVKEYMSEVMGILYRTGSVAVTIESPLLKIHREYRVPQELAYKAVNIIIQGVAAYVMKAGMKRVVDYIAENNLNVRLLVTIHDELIFEIGKEYDIKDMLKQLADQMNDLKTFKVPIIASAKWSDKSWGEAQDIKLSA